MAKALYSRCYNRVGGEISLEMVKFQLISDLIQHNIHIMPSYIIPINIRIPLDRACRDEILPLCMI